MTKLKKEYLLILFALIIVLSQLYRLVIFEDFICNINSNSCQTIQTNIWGAKNNTWICNYSDLNSIKARTSRGTRVPIRPYYKLESITQYNEHKLISTKRYYNYQNCSKIIKILNEKISKHETFNYRFWSLSNLYRKLY